MAYYRDGGCGPYENRSLECPASKPEYELKYQKQETPATDLVRCKDCGIRYTIDCPLEHAGGFFCEDDNGFCSWGRAKEG